VSVLPGDMPDHVDDQPSGSERGQAPDIRWRIEFHKIKPRCPRTFSYRHDESITCV